MTTVIPTRRRSPSPNKNPRGRGTAAAHDRPIGIRKALNAFAYMSPTWLFMIVIGIIPIGYAAWMALTSQRLGETSSHFVGLANFDRAVFTPEFLAALGVTVIFVVVGLVVQFMIGYLLAVCLNRQLRGFKFARTVLLIPMMLTPIVVGLIWLFMFNPDLGVIHFALNAVGIDVNWLAQPTLARIVVVIVDSWMHIPFVMLMTLAGLASLPEEPLESAALDGANWWQTTRYIVLPMLRPVLTIALLVRCVDIARLFDIIYTTTQGGPGTATQNVSMLAYNNTFQFYQFGYGAAIAIALAVIMFPVYFVYLKLTEI